MLQSGTNEGRPTTGRPSDTRKAQNTLTCLDKHITPHQADSAAKPRCWTTRRATGRCGACCRLHPTCRNLRWSGVSGSGRRGDWAEVHGTATNTGERNDSGNVAQLGEPSSPKREHGGSNPPGPARQAPRCRALGIRTMIRSAAWGDATVHDSGSTRTPTANVMPCAQKRPL